MSKFNFKIVYLALFPLSVITVRVLSALGYPPRILAGFSPIGCPLSAIFAIICPTCGLTRSVLFAWNGDYDMSLKYHFGGISLLVTGILLYFILLADKQNLMGSYFKHLKSKPSTRVFFIATIFLYSFWGFFLRSNI